MRMIGRTMLVLAMLAAASSGSIAQAQVEPPKADTPPATRTTAPPTLALTGNIRGVRSDATTGTHLAIEVLDLAVRLRGNVAETRITATFRNTTDQVLEGDFAFDMPAGSVVTGYALDVGGNLVDGVIAGRDQAREAYQRRVVQRIDPGLAEVSWSDRFSTRIFPIPARGSRTIRLVMTSPFDPNIGYSLPMRPDGPVGRLTLRLESDDGQAPRATLPDGIAGRWDGGRFAVDAWNVRLAGALTLVPAPQPARVTYSRHSNGQLFFDIATPAMAEVIAPTRAVHIFWDRSASRADDDTAGEAALIAAWLTRNGASISGLTLFDSGGAETLYPADVPALQAALAAVHYGGATSVAVLGSRIARPDDTCILVSDGRVTIDSRANFSMPCRTHVIASDREVDRGWLGQVASRSGGAFVELGAMSRAAALAALQPGSNAGVRVTDEAGVPIDAIRLSSDSGMLRLIGPMPTRGGIRLVTSSGSVTDFALPVLAPATFDGPGAIWASRQIAAQSTDLTTSDLVAMSRRYSVASPLASFIVLEQPADYVEANIPPPLSYPKALTDQYALLRDAAAQSPAARQADRLRQVIVLWDGQRQWWNRDFSRPAPVEPTPRPGRGRPVPVPSIEVEEFPSSPPSPPPPPPPPAPVFVGQTMAGAPGDAESASDNIVVTATRADGAQAADATGRTEADLRQAGGRNQGDQPPAITLPQWSPSRPWIVAIDAAGNWQAEVDRQRERFGALPAFWFDLAEWHWRHGRPAEARRAAESALDLPARDNQTLEIVADRLQRYGSLDRAIALTRTLADRENERPQPRRKLGVLLMQRAEVAQTAGNHTAALNDLREAIALFADAVLTVRRESPRGFETVTLMDANLAVQRYRSLGGRDHALPPALVAMLDSDIRIVVDWNTPRTDIDLWTTEPDGTRVGFSNTMSPHGGKLSGDVTTGYGPEEYLIRRASDGTYRIELNTYAADRTNPNGPSNATVHLIRNFGRPNQSEEIIDVEMDPDTAGMRGIGEINVTAPPSAPSRRR